MAQSLLAIVETEQTAKIMVILGSLHTLKKLDWEEHLPNKHLSIREYIAFEKPGFKMWSVRQVIGKTQEKCDFTKRFGPLPEAMALDLDDRYRGWKLGLTDTIAIAPAEFFELVDGLIVY